MTAKPIPGGFPALMSRENAVLVVIDAQERLVPAMEGGDAAVARIAILGAAATSVGVPVLVTEQYPKGLGHTVPGLSDLAASSELVEKTEFGAGDIPQVRTWLETTGRTQVILTGFEAHVCVLQSAASLARNGFEVFVAADGVASRRTLDRDTALSRLRTGGVDIVTSEMVVFEWLGGAGAPEFRDLSRLIR